MLIERSVSIDRLPMLNRLLQIVDLNDNCHHGETHTNTTLWFDHNLALENSVDYQIYNLKRYSRRMCWPETVSMQIELGMICMVLLHTYRFDIDFYVFMWMRDTMKQRNNYVFHEIRYWIVVGGS